MARAISDIDLLMIGKTGNGKSALGNAILKRKVFKSKSSTDSVTTKIDFDVTDYNGKIIKVVDGPGVGDTRLNTPESVDLVVKAMEQAMVVNTRGYHAFLLVVRFGGCFTQEDRDTVQFLKKIFGTDFVRRFCILVMTCGDIFERDSEENNPDETFVHWCHHQEGVFQELLRECEHRIVLFDNMTKDDEKRNAQIDELLRVVASLQHRGVRYTDDNFVQAQALREKAIVESKKPVIREVILQETSLILQQLEQIRTNFQREKSVSSLKTLLDRCDDLLQTINDQDNETGALLELYKTVTTTRQAVHEAVQVQSTVTEQRKEMERREKEMRAKMDQEKSRQRKHFEELIAEQKRNEEERKEMEKEMARRREEQEGQRAREREARERELRSIVEEQKKMMERREQEMRERMEEENRKQRQQFEDLIAQQKKNEEDRREIERDMARKKEQQEDQRAREREAMERELRSTMAAQEKRMERKEEEMRAKMEEESRKQRQHFDELIARQRKTEEDRKQMERDIERKRKDIEEKERDLDRKKREHEDRLKKKNDQLGHTSKELDRVYKEEKEENRSFWSKVGGFVKKVGGWFGFKNLSLKNNINWKKRTNSFKS